MTLEEAQISDTHSLKDKAVEHQQPGWKTAVSKHIITCNMYISEFENIACDKPTPKLGVLIRE